MSDQIVQRVCRIIKILGLLQGGRGRNARDLAEVCHVSRRTIFRDLELLRAAHVPLAYDEQRQTYAIAGQYFLPPTSFTSEEALALILLCHEVGGRSNLPFVNAAQTAASKLENQLPERLIDYLRSVASSIQIRLEVTNPLHGRQGFYETLVDAVSKRQAVRLEYDSFTESETINTRLHPYKLLFNQHSWYVIGRSSLHRDVRTFNLARVKRMELLHDAFEMPRNFTVERYLGNAWRLIKEEGDDVEVQIRFSKLVARNVSEVMWHKTQECRFLEDGALEFCVTVSGLNEISWWILGYGDQAEVIRPAALRTLLRGRIQRLLALYSDKPESPAQDGSSD